jgi:hypothetical protein
MPKIDILTIAADDKTGFKARKLARVIKLVLVYPLCWQWIDACRESNNYFPGVVFVV